MSLIPRFFGGQSRRTNNTFDPNSLVDMFDPFQDFPFTSTSLYADLANETTAFVNTRIDWKESSEAHVFTADLPGLKKEDVKVEMEGGRVLQISGEKSKEKEEKKKDDIWHRVERFNGKFFRLPENAKVDQAKANMENGVLTVTVPKEEAKELDVKAVEITV